MNTDIIDDLSLSYTARFVMLWIDKHPSDAINPEVIADASAIPLKLVKAALKELADAKYLNAPARVNDPVKAGRFTWTTFTLVVHAPESPSMDTAPYGEKLHDGEKGGMVEIPVRAETPSVDFPCMAITAYGLSSTVEYAGAAGEKESLKQKESVLSLGDKNKDRQTNSLRPPDKTKSASANTNSLARDFNAASPAVQEQAIQAFVRGNPDLEVDVPDEVRKAYREKWTYEAIGKELQALEIMVSRYGVEFVLEQIKTADLVDGLHKPIRSPACYLKSKLENQETEGKFKPEESKPTRSGKPSVDKPPPRRAVDDWFNRMAGG